jgi:hypothetical protein
VWVLHRANGNVKKKKWFCFRFRRLLLEELETKIVAIREWAQIQREMEEIVIVRDAAHDLILVQSPGAQSA